MDWGIPDYGGGACVIATVEGATDADHCVILCEVDELTGPCPTGLTCTAASGGSICQ